jgi:hypothetical protein
MIFGRNVKPTRFQATISYDWDPQNPSTYDPDYLWEAEFPSAAEAIESIKTMLPIIANKHPWPHGYIPSVMHLGPRGGIRKSTAERTLEHPDLVTAVEALRARQ